MKIGDRIRVQSYMYNKPIGTDDYTVEMFRYSLGVFLSENDRTAQVFTPLCSLYEPGPDSKTRYLSNYGEYSTNQVQAWMDIPKE